MKILIVSDLHFEFHMDGGRSLVDDLTRDADVLVAAGDVAVGEGIPDALDLLCERFREVVYLAGNHEYYLCPRERVRALTDGAARRRRNLHVLWPGTPRTVLGQKFVGGTLWFPPAPRAPKSALNDFRLIPDFESWVYEENARTVRFLEQTVVPSDVVVTHHLPSYASVAPKHSTSPLNPFFVCSVERVIRGGSPKLWVHGHTHESVDYLTDSTRVVCNPHGYPHELNPKFDPNFVVDTNAGL